MRYLITGVTGFVGPHLANALVEKGHSVSCLLRASNGRELDIRDVVSDSSFAALEFLYGDLLDHHSCVEAIARSGCDGVFHLAAQSHPPTSFVDPRSTMAVNVMGTVNLAEAIRSTAPDCRLLYCSTSEVYGAPLESQGPIDELFPLVPVNPYGVSKAAADLFVRERAISEQLPFVVARAFSHTGPRRGHRYSIASDTYQLVRIEKGYQEPVLRVGTLTSKRVVMDVRDVARAYLALMEMGAPGEAYNVGGDEVFEIGDLVDAQIEIFGRTGRIRIEEDPALVRRIDIPVQIPNSQKARTLTGWKPEIAIMKTLEDLINYYRAKVA